MPKRFVSADVDVFNYLFFVFMIKYVDTDIFKKKIDNQNTTKKDCYGLVLHFLFNIDNNDINNNTNENDNDNGTLYIRSTIVLCVGEL